MTLNINLYAGPGVGKSVLAATVFVALKMRGIHCELVSEYAKELQYDGTLRDTPQSEILEEQLRRQSRLQGNAEVVVTDAPVPLSLAYCHSVELPVLQHFVTTATRRWHCVNVLLHRDLDEGYEAKGRYQCKEEAKAFHANVMTPFVQNYHPDLVELHVNEARDWLVNYVDEYRIRQLAA